ncbi:MAG: 1-(5-phosphoribosyl)-5-[(5-phosphoribosylamino)methylideneamino]imidazole-4-carboxamide isomerase [Planctomyces sp.]|nr:1-(5-phosphoribosyl)-5-[(5-phosphoribosylamino)methylideneamino]imidazole-4-carboxamide isomerase [Planctomyces sp.]
MEIIPAIDLRGGRCVRLRQGDYSQETVFDDDPPAVAQRFADQGATRLHLVDLDGAKAGRPVNADVVRRIVDAVDLPCQLGGGIRDDESIRQLLEDVGVDRVIIGTQALKQPEWFRKTLDRFPSQVVLGIDARDGLVATAGWLDVSEVRALDLPRQFRDSNLAAIIYTNIANDGMLQGIDEGTLADLAEFAQLGVDVIASGGVTSIADIQRLCVIERDHPRLIGAIVGRALYEGQLSLEEAIAATGPPGESAG